MFIPKTKPNCCLHFGCDTETGHHVHWPQSHRSVNSIRELLSIKEWMEQMDQKLHDDQSDNWLVHHFTAADLSKMTFITRRDRTVDTRPGSWCGFLMPEILELEEALTIAKRDFPDLKIWK